MSFATDPKCSQEVLRKLCTFGILHESPLSSLQDIFVPLDQKPTNEQAARFDPILSRIEPLQQLHPIRSPSLRLLICLDFTLFGYTTHKEYVSVLDPKAFSIIVSGNQGDTVYIVHCAHLGDALRPLIHSYQLFFYTFLPKRHSDSLRQILRGFGFETDPAHFFALKEAPGKPVLETLGFDDANTFFIDANPHNTQAFDMAGPIACVQAPLFCLSAQHYQEILDNKLGVRPTENFLGFLGEWELLFEPKKHFPASHLALTIRLAEEIAQEWASRKIKYPFYPRKRSVSKIIKERRKVWSGFRIHVVASNEIFQGSAAKFLKTMGAVPSPVIEEVGINIAYDPVPIDESMSKIKVLSLDFLRDGFYALKRPKFDSYRLSEKPGKPPKN